MDQDQYHIVELQPLKVLDLFPKRQIETLTLNYQNYSKLYQNLTCTICRQLFKTPVYLKCSHRFCKECIQKYIRSSAKRSCPNCRGQLSTKRDLRSDYSLQSLINFAFTDVKSFTASMEQFDKLDIQRSKSSELKKIDSLNECKQRTRQQAFEQFGNVTPGFKRVKTNDLDQPKKKRKLQSQRKVQSKNPTQKQEKEANLTNKSIKMIDQKQASKQVEVSSKNQTVSKPQIVTPIINIQNFTKQKSRKKKKIQVIQIESNSQQHDQEVQEIRRDQFLNPTQMVEDKKISSFSVIPEVLPQIDSKVYSFQEIPIQAKSSIMSEQKDQNVQKDQQSQQQNFDQQLSAKISKQSSDIKKQASPQILRAIQLLQVQFGSDFPLKIIQLTSFPFYTDLTLKRHPLSILTPEIVKGSYKFSLRTALTSVSTFIADSLNINWEAIKLHIVLGVEAWSYAQVSPSLKLYQVNQRYWKNWYGVELLQSIELINGGYQECSEGRKIQRTIYYSIDFSKLNV